MCLVAAWRVGRRFGDETPAATGTEGPTDGRQDKKTADGRSHVVGRIGVSCTAIERPAGTCEQEHNDFNACSAGARYFRGREPVKSSHGADAQRGRRARRLRPLKRRGRWEQAWLSGSVAISPCQGWGRGFESLCPLQFIRYVKGDPPGEQTGQEAWPKRGNGMQRMFWVPRSPSRPAECIGLPTKSLVRSGGAGAPDKQEGPRINNRG